MTKCSHPPVSFLAATRATARGRGWKEGLDAAVRLLSGEVPESVVVREGLVRYRAYLWSGLKTGGLLDQRENKLAAEQYASGRGFDVFSYAGGFGLHAAPTR